MYFLDAAKIAHKKGEICTEICNISRWVFMYFIKSLISLLSNYIYKINITSKSLA